MSQTLVVAFSSLHSCLVNLPPRWVAALAAQPASRACMVFRVSWQQQTAYVAWSGGVAQSNIGQGADVLEMDGTFGRALGLGDGARVRVEYVPDVATCTAAEVEPASADDWEILSLNAGAVEERLLQQARVVAVGQPIVFWLSPSTVVRLATAAVTPRTQACCLLANDSEVVVAPRPRARKAQSSQSPAASVTDTAAVYCMRIAADVTATAAATVYANPAAPVACLAGKSVRIARALHREDSEVAADSSGSAAATAAVSASLAASDKVQPGVLLASPALLSAAGLSPGEAVRVQVAAAGEADGTDKTNETSGAPPALEAGVTAFIDDAWRCVDSALAGGGGGLLVCGRRGAGKSSVVRAVAARAAQGTRLVFVRHVDCAALALEPQTARVVAALRAAAREALAGAPAVLVLDDVDAVTPAAVEHGDDRRARRVAEALVAATRGVAVLATAASRAAVHARVLGAGVFGATREIPPPRAAERELMLAAVAAASAAPPAPATSFAAAAYATEGYAPADLRALYERATHEAAVRAVAAESSRAARVEVTAADLTRALAGFRPAALRSLRVSAAPTARWSDIGGLRDARRLLRETLELPARYGAVFASSPLRLRSGVLLYGFPGCGKTLLAAAAARECGLSLVATKGPELLSKYIGSSEQAVRDLFRRAAAAAPCVLFFDEFDAIAPRRGHDSTGVTDRVVNQFLTEMDGAEGLAGVYVLAATSRPDLIDPALLRPGRLDKALLCPLPDAADRADILARHAARLRTAAAIDWPALAARAENFTGADLQALVYNAFLEAVHERTQAPLPGASASAPVSEAAAPVFAMVPALPLLPPPERTQLAERLIRLIRPPAASPSDAPSSSPQASDVPVVTMAHFDAALATTHASLAAPDRERYAAIYSAFVGDRKDAIDRQPRAPVEQRATLA
ncbi:Peroxisome biosynthesis protein pex1 [Coemansia thaxteri]|nr:Peroxisome biosynthesis protein pex1 [Coemansia thaxteri]